MKLTKVSGLTGVEHTLTIPITEKEYSAWLHASNAPFVQDAFPQLSIEQREFLLTGITPEEWNSLLPPEEEDE